MPSAMVTFNGRITLPPHVRKQLGLRTGDSVEFVEIEKGRFAIAPRAESEGKSNEIAMSDLSGWVPSIDFEGDAEEPRFRELDELIQ